MESESNTEADQALLDTQDESEEAKDQPQKLSKDTEIPPSQLPIDVIALNLHFDKNLKEKAAMYNTEEARRIYRTHKTYLLPIQNLLMIVFFLIIPI
jgi:hypothetical protein